MPDRKATHLLSWRDLDIIYSMGNDEVTNAFIFFILHKLSLSTIN